MPEAVPSIVIFQPVWDCIIVQAVVRSRDAFSLMIVLGRVGGLADRRLADGPRGRGPSRRAKNVIQG